MLFKYKIKYLKSDIHCNQLNLLNLFSVQFQNDGVLNNDVVDVGAQTNTVVNASIQVGVIVVLLGSSSCELDGLIY